ncbi:MAG: hypothetical protein ABFC63_12420 [Thermoguttaceae bacterium]
MRVKESWKSEETLDAEDDDIIRNRSLPSWGGVDAWLAAGQTVDYTV